MVNTKRIKYQDVIANALTLFRHIKYEPSRIISCKGLYYNFLYYAVFHIFAPLCKAGSTMHLFNEQ